MDYRYWNEYYNKNVAPNEESSFAYYILKFLEKDKKLIELGCGNGRDSIFFANNKIDVTAVDQSDIAIKNLKDKYNNIKFICDDFVKTEQLSSNTFDYVYSRFTLHSISNKDELILLKRIYNALKTNGLLFIEARSIKDEIFGLGEKVDHNAYIYNEHYRRFIEIEELTNKVKELGFDVIYSQESNNWAVYKEQDPVVIRIIAKKN